MEVPCWYRPRFLASLKGVAPPDAPIEGLPAETEPVFRVKIVPNGTSPKANSNGVGLGLDLDLAEFSHQRPFTAPIHSASLISGPEASKRIYAVRLEVSKLSGWNWMPGDAFGVLPENDPEVVLYALSRLGMNPEESVRLHVIGKVARESLAEFFTACKESLTLGELFTKHLDWTYFPKKACLAQLAACCQDPAEQRDLLFLATKAGSANYLQVAGERTTLLDILHTFPSCAPSLEVLLRHLPLLHPRFYSISSTPLDAQGCIIEFVFNTIEYKTPDGLPRKGLCSAWIENRLGSNAPLSLVPRPNSTVFRPPNDPTTPLIMVCAGTGISPFIGFLRHYSQTTTTLDAWLFYGFQSMESDFLFRKEIEEFHASGLLPRLTLTPSRQPEMGLSQYVQHAMEKHRVDLWQCLSKDPRSRIYICGDELTMVKAVNEQIVAMLAESMQISHKEAQILSQNWIKEGRIIRDVWI